MFCVLLLLYLNSAFEHTCMDMGTLINCNNNRIIRHAGLHAAYCAQGNL